MKKHILRLIFLLFWLTLSACGVTQPANRPDFAPIHPDPTLTPTSVAAKNAAPTSVVSNQVSLNSYTHSTRRFSLSYPANWQSFEKPDGVVFLDPGGHAGYSVFFSDVGKAYSKEELNQYLATFIDKNFAKKELGYTPLSQKSSADGSIVATFSSTDPKLGPAVNEVRISQRDTIVYVVYMSVSQEQWQISQSQFHRLADTLTPLDTKPAAKATSTDEPPVWVLTGPTGNAFGFFYPSDWQISHRDESSITVTMPDSDLVFEASVFEGTKDQANFDAAQKAAQKYVDDLKKEHKNVQSRPVEKFQLDQSADGATIDFLYTDTNGVAKAGSIITAANAGKIYQVVFSSSAKVYSAALQWFNPMYKGFRILPAGQVIQKP